MDRTPLQRRIAGQVGATKINLIAAGLALLPAAYAILYGTGPASKALGLACVLGVFLMLAEISVQLDRIRRSV